jgi:hypothetical protein
MNTDIVIYSDQDIEIGSIIDNEIDIEYNVVAHEVFNTIAFPFLIIKKKYHYCSYISIFLSIIIVCYVLYFAFQK